LHLHCSLVRIGSNRIARAGCGNIHRCLRAQSRRYCKRINACRHSAVYACVFRFLATVSEALQGFAVRLSSSAGVGTHSDPAPDISGRTQVFN
jgi:hypothetical protein